MATIKRYRYIIDNDANYINDNPQIKVYKGNSSNQAELISNNFEEIEEVSTDIDFTKTTFTEAEVETAIKCNAVSNFKVGDILTISNIYCSQWVVIGKDHDGTTGTIDIMATNQVDNIKYGSSNIYEVSDNYVGGDAIYRSYNSFTNMIISSACKIISFKVATSLTAGIVFNEKAKIISCVELNFSTFDSNMPGYDSYKEGEPYTYFTRGAWDAATAKRWVPAGSYGTNYYFTRSMAAFNGVTNIWLINNKGIATNSGSSTNRGVVPILRLGSMIYEP